jgi:hypothetical protein
MSAESVWIVGESVPWSVAWTSEDTYSLQPDPDFPGLLEVVQAESPGLGAPRFAANHLGRNRRGLLANLCHVCGERTDDGDRWLFPGDSGGFVTMPDRSLLYAANVPPVHRRCGEKAARLCPHLSRRYAQPVAYPLEEESRVFPRTDIRPGMEAIRSVLPPGQAAVLGCFRLFGPRFSAAVGRLRPDPAPSVVRRPADPSPGPDPSP